MKNRAFIEHCLRLRTAVLHRHTVASIAKYIEKETTIGLRPYSYKDHEYQEAIIGDVSQETVTQKCSQIGASEAELRKALALVNVIQPYTVCYTLPTAKFASTFMKTRIDPVIRGSKSMRESIQVVNDNQEIKQFGDSFLYLKGAASTNAPISIPVDHLMHDEVDFCDQTVLGQYISRLTHSKWKRIDRFSTPTLPNFGINKFFRESRRHYLMAKCHHCNHWFNPDYFENVKIPGFTGDLQSVTKGMLSTLKWKDAALHCPKCGLIPSLQWEQREWVCENPTENFVAAGRQVSPFDAPNIITCSDLIKASTGYDRHQDFVNFNLGLPAEDRESTLSYSDLLQSFHYFDASADFMYVMGVDVGSTYHFFVAGINGMGDMFNVHRESCGMGAAREKYWELKKRFHVVCTVMDSMPHAETVMALQDMDNNLYAAVYTKSKGMLTYSVVMRDDESDAGKKYVRQVNINRSRAFDGYMEAIRSRAIHFLDGDDKELVITHHRSMKRVKTYDAESGELAFSWQKTDGNDHYHHASLYCWIAGQIRGVERPSVRLPIMSMFSMKIRDKD